MSKTNRELNNPEEQPKTEEQPKIEEQPKAVKKAGRQKKSKEEHKERKPAEKPSWLKLDNAGKIFPAENTPTWSHVIRETAVLNKAVDPKVLTQALEDVMPRFPCYAMRMRNGFFWNYLEANDKKCPKVRPDIKNACRRISWYDNDGFMFRVFYSRNRISVEFFHAITDGYGMTCFLMTLVARYLTLKGNEIPASGFVLDINEQPSEEELEDAFSKYNKQKGKPKKNKGGVYHFVGTKLRKHRVHITTGYMSVKQIKELAKKQDATITEFMATVLLYAMYKQQEEEYGMSKKPLAVQIPMNGRFKLPSHTLRNFSLSTTAYIDPRKKDFTFDEVLEEVKSQLRTMATKENFSAMVRKNTALERNPFIRLIPRAIKSRMVSFGYNIIAEHDTSILITNVGKITVPDEMLEHVQKVAFMPAPGHICGARTAAASFGDVFALSFMDIYKEKNVERKVFRDLMNLGLDVELEANYPFACNGVKSKNPYPNRTIKPGNDKFNVKAVTGPLGKLTRTFFVYLNKTIKYLHRKLDPMIKEWFKRYFHV